MKEIYATNNEVDLQMLIGILDSQGITAEVKADGAGDYFRVAGSDFNINKRVLVKDEDWEKALSLAESNGFKKEKSKVKRDNSQIWVARIVLVIFVVAILGGILFSLLNN
mgnify:CR=1 FL=1